MKPSKLPNEHCPVCAAPLRLSKEAAISWNEERKEFNVSLKRICPPCGYGGDLVIKALPLSIAKASSCSCGGSLVLSDHSIIMKDGDLDFRATYKCSSCHKDKKTLLSRVIGGLKQVWKDTTSVEVGPSGIKFGKRAS